MKIFTADYELVLLSLLLLASTVVLVIKASSALREKFDAAKKAIAETKEEESEDATLLKTDSMKSESAKEPSEPHRTVLIVDDDAVTRLPLRIHCEKLGFKVDEVPDGNSAVLAYSQGNRFCMVIMDYEMPDMDGLSAIRQIRLHDNDVVIVGSTIHDPATVQNEFLKAGANFVTIKPITAEKLREIIAEYNLNSETPS